MKPLRIHLTSLGVEDVVGDIVQTFRIALERLGHNVTYQHSAVAPEALNIVFFCWGLQWSDLAGLQPNCIVVNFEHLTPGGRFFPEPYREILQRSYVWEYSESNFQRMPQLGIPHADHTPLGYEEGAAPVLPLEALLPEEQRDIDVLFFGLQSPRRVRILDGLRAMGLRVETTSQRHWSPQERDAYLLRSKVVLNIHNYDDSRIVEIPRLSILFRHRKAIVCELYPDSEIEPSLRNAMVGAEYDALVNATAALVADPARRAALEGHGLPLFSARPQSTSLAPALERFLEWKNHVERIEPQEVPACEMRVSVIVALGEVESHRGACSVSPVALPSSLKFEVLEIGSSAAGSQSEALNSGLRQANGDFVVFVCGTDVFDSERIVALATYLAQRPEIDAVGGWQASLDHDIKAAMLASAPTSTQPCLFRRRFLLENGIVFDAAFAGGTEAHFIFQCMAAGGHFASLALDASSPDDKACTSAPSLAPSPDATEVMRARRWLLARVFPDLATAELDLLVLLYAPLWEPTAAFAERLLSVICKAALQKPLGLNFPPAQVRRVLRNEALRLLRIYHHAKLVDLQWLHAQQEDIAIASFLAPVRDALLALDHP